jgi:methanogenic corrinoid protein MtbC1
MSKYEEAGSRKGSALVSNLAHRVLCELGQKAPAEAREQIQKVAHWLAVTCSTPGSYSHEAVLKALMQKGVSNELLIDTCIPEAARTLGAGWDDNTRSFGQVSLGTVRLQGLVQELSAQWKFNPGIHDQPSVLVAICGDEDHILGPLILSDQLRRLGYSVKLLLGATEKDVHDNIETGFFDMVMFSCSSVVSLDNVAKVVKSLRQEISDPPILLLGGAVLGQAPEIEKLVAVDVIASGLTDALEQLESEQVVNAGKATVSR